ncbi:hypothetical protein BaRGS_00035729 [Batillaria attramentaria]|uniref:Uncharacterized protein n=1 Tax=Batillaria attramentaria TaxID=370345 RepID=A0ABD0JDW0_9CAEN
MSLVMANALQNWSLTWSCYSGRSAAAAVADTALSIASSRGTPLQLHSGRAETCLLSGLTLSSTGLSHGRVIMAILLLRQFPIQLCPQQAPEALHYNFTLVERRHVSCQGKTGLSHGRVIVAILLLQQFPRHVCP